MRKNTARHWLHATLDLLPVILIPVFMIYSHRHDLSTDITIQQDVYKDFYQGVKNGKPYSLDNITINQGIDDEIINNSLFAYSDTDIQFTFDIENFVVNEGDYLYITYAFNTNSYEYESAEFYYGGNGEYYNQDSLPLKTPINTFTTYSEYIEYVSDTDAITYLTISYYSNISYLEFYIKDVQLFNLTTIFGSGNEPTKEVFESYLTKDYYDFGSNEVKVGTIDVQAKNNDIMSVFMDSFNNSVNKYFNMGNVFNLNNVYEWFNANLFGGNAPVVIYSVYNIVVYELVMDLLFLLYGLFMWFIDMLKRLIEKPIDSIK